MLLFPSFSCQVKIVERQMFHFHCCYEEGNHNPGMLWVPVKFCRRFVNKVSRRNTFFMGYFHFKATNHGEMEMRSQCLFFKKGIDLFYEVLQGIYKNITMSAGAAA